MKPVSGKRMCQILGSRGWRLARISGSHHIYRQPDSGRRTSVPVHGNADLKPRTQRSIAAVRTGAPFVAENAVGDRRVGQGHPPITLALAAVLEFTIAMWAGGTKPERPLMSFGVIETTQVQRTVASLVNPVFECLPGGFLYGNFT